MGVMPAFLRKSAHRLAAWAAAAALILQPVPAAASQVSAPGKGIVRPVGPVSTALGGGTASAQISPLTTPAAVPGPLPSVIPSAPPSGSAYAAPRPSAVAAQPPAVEAADRTSTAEVSSSNGLPRGRTQRGRPSGRSPRTELERLEQAGEKVREARSGRADLPGALDELFLGSKSRERRAGRRGGRVVSTERSHSPLARRLAVDPGMDPGVREDLERLLQIVDRANPAKDEWTRGLEPALASRQRRFFQWLKQQLTAEGNLPLYELSPHFDSVGYYHEDGGLSLIHSRRNGSARERLSSMVHEAFHRWAGLSGLPMTEGGRQTQERDARISEALLAEMIEAAGEARPTGPAAADLRLIRAGKSGAILASVDAQYRGDEGRPSGERLLRQMAERLQELKHLRGSLGGMKKRDGEAAAGMLERRIAAIEAFLRGPSAPADPRAAARELAQRADDLLARRWAGSDHARRGGDFTEAYESLIEETIARGRLPFGEAELEAAEAAGLLVRGPETVPVQCEGTCATEGFVNHLRSLGIPFTAAEFRSILMEHPVVGETFLSLALGRKGLMPHMSETAYRAVAQAKGIGLEVHPAHRLFRTIFTKRRTAVASIIIKGSEGHRILVEGLVPTEAGLFVSMIDSNAGGRVALPLTTFARQFSDDFVMADPEAAPDPFWDAEFKLFPEATRQWALAKARKARAEKRQALVDAAEHLVRLYYGEGLPFRRERKRQRRVLADPAYRARLIEAVYRTELAEAGEADRMEDEDLVEAARAILDRLEQVRELDALPPIEDPGPLSRWLNR